LRESLSNIPFAILNIQQNKNTPETCWGRFSFCYASPLLSKKSPENNFPGDFFVAKYQKMIESLR